MLGHGCTDLQHSDVLFSASICSSISVLPFFSLSAEVLCDDYHKIALDALAPDDRSGCYLLSEIFRNILPHHA
jgi:hypothetical protein